VIKGRFLYNNKAVEGIFKDGKIEIDGFDLGLSQVKFLPPVMPSKIICVGLNYEDHAKELKMDIPDEPIIFLKPPSAVIGHEDNIVYPRISRRVDYEAELGVVIGKKCKDVKEDEAADVILGYTAFNDITARDLQKKDGQWTRAKSFDTFAPLGPYIVTQDEIADPQKLSIKLFLNGELKQDSSTRNFIFEIPYLIEFISGIMTLQPGDIIATGTPPGVGPMKVGDIIEIEIDKIGVLRNYVSSRAER
jgi:4-hydroxyphenylacetate degradation bifunctional isomerase/decarboxylase decarboxylase subunit